jgi:enoyl-CoA hydratase
MTYKNIVINKKGRIGILIISRPEKLNVLNTQTLVEMEKALHLLSDDAEVGIIIITGSGEKAFVAGGDISSMVEMSPFDSKKFLELGHRVLRLIEDMPKPVIAAVNGYALGGGLELAIACDLIFAPKSAKLGQPEVNLGIIPGFGGTQRLTRLIGRAKTKELILTGEIIDADEACRLGLVNKVFDDAIFLEKVFEVAEKILKKAPLAIAMAKKAVNEGADLPLEAANSLEIMDFTILMSTEDQKEGMKAFLEKRKPVFKGK